MIALATIQGIRSSPSVTVVRIRSRDEERALAILEQYTDNTFSLTDAASFAVMERLHVSEAFSLDHHFAQYGWTVVPGELR